MNQYQSIGSNNSLSVSQFKSDSFNLSVLVSCFQSLTMFQTEVNSLTVKSVSFRKLVYIVFSQSVLVCNFQSVSFSTLLSFSQFLSVIFSHLEINININFKLSLLIYVYSNLTTTKL